MSELELLFLVLVCLYAWECACWLPRGSVALLTWFGRRWQAGHPGTLLGNQHGGFIFAPPLPPLGNLVTANQFPLSLSPEAALAYLSTSVNPGWRPPQSGRLLRFEQIKSIQADGKTVRVNGEPWLKAASRGFANHVVRHLNHLQSAAAAERGKWIENIFRESLDTRAIERRWQEFRKLARPLRWLTNALFVYLFLLVPALIWHFGLRLTWVGLLLGLLALTASTAIFFRRAHQALYPEADDERFTHFLMVLLAPATAMRAHDILSRRLLETFHPLGVVRVFCPAPAFRQFAARMLVELRFPALPVVPAGEPGVQAVERFSRAALQKAVEALLVKNDLQPDELVRPPAPADDSCRAYCPRCGAQFTTGEGTCPDCGGLPLVAFKRG